MVNKTDIAPASREFIHNEYTKQDTQTETKPILSCEGVPTGFLPCKEKAFTQLLGLQFTPDVCLSFQPFSFSPILLFPSPVSHLANSHWASVVTIWIQTLANSIAWAQASAFPALTMCLGMDSSHTHTRSVG